MRRLHPDHSDATIPYENSRDDFTSVLGDPDESSVDVGGQGVPDPVRIDVTPPELLEEGAPTSSHLSAREGGLAQVIERVVSRSPSNGDCSAVVGHDAASVS